jgi:precorrin-6Y C5,15-methyltransferase (decarboxylating)
VATAFARAGMAWEDAQVVSAHGGRLRRAANVCRAHPKVAVLTTAEAGPSELALMLRGVPRTFVVCEALGTPEEDVTVLTSERVPDHDWRDPSVVLVIGNVPPAEEAAGWLAGKPVGYPGAHRGWALPAEAYAGADPGTRRPRLLPAHVRALALAKLAPAPGDLLWTVGAGDGALAVEAARFGAAVVAVEAEPADCARISAHARRVGVELETAAGSGPEVLGALPEPDAVAVEHGGPAMVRAVAARKPERVVAVARGLAEAGEIRQILDGAGYRTDGLLLQSAPLRTDHATGGGPSFGRGDYTLLIWAEPGD